MMHYYYYNSYVTDDLLSHILSYCNYDDANHAVMALSLPKPTTLLSSSCDAVQQQERFQNLPVWYELFRRDGYVLNDDDAVTIPASGGSICSINTQQQLLQHRTNYRYLYQYRRKIHHNLFGTSSFVTASDSDITEAQQHPNWLMATTRSLKHIHIVDLLSDHRSQQGSRFSVAQFSRVDLQVISNATGSSIVALDHSFWANKDDGKIDGFSTLTLFPMLLDPSNYARYSFEDQAGLVQKPYSIVLHHRLDYKDKEEDLMKILPCQQFISEGGYTATIIGCTVSDWDLKGIEFRFWRIVYVSDNNTIDTSRSNNTPKVVVEKYGFCRIAGIRVESATFTYFYPSLFGGNPENVTNRPKIYMTTEETKNLVYEFRINAWSDDDDDIGDTVERHEIIEQLDCNSPPFDNAECTWEVPNVIKNNPKVKIAGVTTSSDGSMLLVLFPKNSIQLWNMTTAFGGSPDITYIPMLELLTSLVVTYFPSGTLLHSLLHPQNPTAEPLFRLDFVTPFFAETLPIDKFGFVTFCTDYTPIQICLLILWEYDCVTASWQISSIIVLPLSRIELPQIHYDGKRLIVLGQDNLGYVILIYQIHWVHDEMLRTSELNPPSPIPDHSVARIQESGGVYNFPDRSHFPFNLGRSDTTLRTSSRRSRIEFRNHIRHEAFEKYSEHPIRNACSIRISCNERYLIVQTTDDMIRNRIVFFDLDSSKYDA